MKTIQSWGYEGDEENRYPVRLIWLQYLGWIGEGQSRKKGEGVLALELNPWSRVCRKTWGAESWSTKGSQWGSVVIRGAWLSRVSKWSWERVHRILQATVASHVPRPCERPASIIWGSWESCFGLSGGNTCFSKTETKIETDMQLIIWLLVGQRDVRISQGRTGH